MSMLFAVLALGTLTMVLLLAVLGAMRETVLLRAEMNAFEQLIKRPPPPSFVNDIAPVVLIDALQASTSDALMDAQTVVAFLSPHCKPCEDLAAGLSAAMAAGPQLRRDQMFFVIPSTPSTREDAAELVSQLPGQVFVDVSGSVTRACEIHGTPTILVVSRVDNKVVDYNLEGDVQWVLRRLHRDTNAHAATQPVASS